MKTPTGEHLKPRSQYVEDAIRLAMESKWDEAAELNEFILENFGPDEESQNRLGKALAELGRLDDAKAAYEATIALNPMNSIARKNARGAYFQLRGTIVRPPRDLVLMATMQASDDVILSTAQYPKGELRVSNEVIPTAGGTGGGHCC